MTENSLEKRNSPDYLSQFGLNRAPFSTTVEHDMYYHEPTRTQRLDMLIHLSQYSHDLLLVTGTPGSGKTSLLTQFLHNTNKTWKICQIDAHPQTDQEQLLLRISHSFNLSIENFDIDQAYTDLNLQLEEMLTRFVCVLVIVDNAHLLNKEALNKLCELNRITNTISSTSIRVLLFSEPQIRPLIEEFEIPFRGFDLPPLSEQHVRELIYQRLDTAGATDHAMFTDNVINKIFKLSGGVPGKVVEIAHRIMSDAPIVSHKSEPEKKSPIISKIDIEDIPPQEYLITETFARKPAQRDHKPRRSKQWTRSVFAVLFGVVIVLLLVYEEDINRLFSTLPTSELTPSAEAQKKTIVALEIPALDSEGSAETAISAPSIDSTISPEMSDADETTRGANVNLAPPKTSATEQTVASNHTAEESAAAHKDTDTAVFAPQNESIESQNSTIPVPAPVAPPPPPTPQTPAVKRLTSKSKAPPKAPAKTTQSKGINSNGLKSTQWINQQNPEHYTLQLIAGYQLDTIKNFIKHQKLAKQDLAYYLSVNKDKDWHSLLYGVYPDYETAKAASLQLQKKLKKVKPWIRPFKSIQKDIAELNLT